MDTLKLLTALSDMHTMSKVGALAGTLAADKDGNGRSDIVDLFDKNGDGILDIKQHLDKNNDGVIDMIEDQHTQKSVGWKVGDPIDNLTSKGNEPSWSTVRQRYWKNEAYYNPSAYTTENLERMKKGLAPRQYNIDTGLMESKELHHIDGRDIPNPHNIENLKQVWPEEHEKIDPHRKLGR